MLKEQMHVTDILSFNVENDRLCK